MSTFNRLPNLFVFGILQNQAALANLHFLLLYFCNGKAKGDSAVVGSNFPGTYETTRVTL